MRRALPLFVLMAVLLSTTTDAQQATLNSPVSRAAEDNFRAETIFATRDAGGRWEVQVSVRDSSGNEIRRVVFSGPDAAHSRATALAILTAYTTARSGETGSL